MYEFVQLPIFSLPNVYQMFNFTKTVHQDSQEIITKITDESQMTTDELQTTTDDCRRVTEESHMTTDE